MAIRISKTGAIYSDHPFTQAELAERDPSATKEESAAQTIALERVEAGRHAFVAVVGDVQVVGCCIKRDGGWYIEDRVGKNLAGPFGTLTASTSAVRAALVLAQLVTEADLAQGSLYPELPRIREVSAHIAAEVARVAYARGLATGAPPDDVLAHVKSNMYEPRYGSYA